MPEVNLSIWILQKFYGKRSRSLKRTLRPSPSKKFDIVKHLRHSGHSRGCCVLLWPFNEKRAYLSEIRNFLNKQMILWLSHVLAFERSFRKRWLVRRWYFCWSFCAKLAANMPLLFLWWRHQNTFGQLGIICF